jgi:hypothetical protein
VLLGKSCCLIPKTPPPPSRFPNFSHFWESLPKGLSSWD